MHYTCQSGHLELLKYIASISDFEVDFNVVDSIGWTPLHLASYYGQYEAVKFLFQNYEDKGIDVARKTSDGDTAEDLAKEEGHQDISEVLKVWTMQIAN